MLEGSEIRAKVLNRQCHALGVKLRKHYLLVLLSRVQISLFQALVLQNLCKGSSRESLCQQEAWTAIHQENVSPIIVTKNFHAGAFNIVISSTHG